MNERKPRAIIIGDSTNNTLSAVRSLGEARIDQILILVCENDICFVSKSKYLKHSKIFNISYVESSLEILKSLKSTDYIQTIICTFDLAAEYIDRNEELLSSDYITPARGRHIGLLFNKDEQCKLAVKCGLTVPKSIVFSRKDDLNRISLDYPVLLKPINSTKGEKSDIHICNTTDDIRTALMQESHCQDFVIQEFIEKEYEVNCIGVKTDNETYLTGGIKKIRHFPSTVGACTYGVFKRINKYSNINIDAINSFLCSTNYHGPFSVEFLYKNGKYYFMEVNLRNDGLSYASTAAGANTFALYINNSIPNRINEIYLMNYSIDLLHVRNREITIWKWIMDLMRTRCFINVNFRDIMPTICYYKTKFFSRK